MGFVVKLQATHRLGVNEVLMQVHLLLKLFEQLGVGLFTPALLPQGLLRQQLGLLVLIEHVVGRTLSHPEYTHYFVFPLFHSLNSLSNPF